MPSAISKLLPKDMPQPHSSAIDKATIVHSVSPQARGKKSRSGIPLNTWREYADKIVQHLPWTLCSREGKVDGQVIFDFDKWSRVKPKSFAHTKRGLFSSSKGARKKPHGPLSKEEEWRFGLDDRTPLRDEWQDFLKNRQYSDGVFSVLCQYIRGEFESIRAKKSNNTAMTWSEHCLGNLRLRIDGEPILSQDFLETSNLKSWYNDKDGFIIGDDGNGIGEGELRALHHAYLVGLLQRPLTGEGDGSSSEINQEGQGGTPPV